MTTTDTGWAPRAAHLADTLVDAGALHDREWQAAFREVPRHLFVPKFYLQPEHGGWDQVSGAEPAQVDAWLDAVYGNRSLVTALDERGWAVSSSSQPSLMARMLEMLDVRDGHRVLEIGTGTGYNAGLLSHRLGADRVFSVDIAYVDDARERLLTAGYRPQLAEVDGAAGWPEHSPYDRIIATCSVPHLPWAWAEQIVDGGLVLVDIKIETNAGNLVLLRRESDQLLGRFAPKWAGFMTMRHPGATLPVEQAAIPHLDRERTTSAPATPWQDQLVLWFLAALHLPAGVRCGFVLDETTRRPSAATISAPDGSACEVALADDGAGTRQVCEGGPTPLWEHIESAHDQWRRWGEPGWDRLGLTVRSDEQIVWLDNPDTMITRRACDA